MNEQIAQIKKISTAGLAGIAIFFLSFSFFNIAQSSLLGLIAFLVVLWTNEGLPLAVVSLMPIVLFPAFGVLSTKATAVNYSNPIIFLFLGGFLLAIAVEKTGLHRYLAEKILSFFPDTVSGIIYSLIITSALLSAILSNTTTALLLMPIALYITQEERLKMRFALAIAYGASVGGILTPIGTPPNLILFGIMQEHSLVLIPFLKWVLMVAPLCFVMIFVVGFLLSIGVKNVKMERKGEVFSLTREQKKVMYILTGLIMLLFVNAPIRPYWNGLGLNESAVLLGTGLLLFIEPFRILEWMSDKERIPYRIMFLFGAGFSIAAAFTKTGLADALASYILGFTALSPMLLILIVAVLITFTTEITSNTALVSIMLPVIYAVALKAGINVTLFMMIATVCASYAFMLPIATPPNAIAMSSGAVDVRTMMKYGLFLNIAGIISVVILAEFFWKSVL
ncbi:DASS family sodium-coupled anion symporter [Sulfurimonas sp. HSL-1716]|uniref:SLC13 family permease n=1 Tax=Hydrocurvibacter sulfurireducens TaxID=3131937 RepID=UPI0031F8E817